MLPKIVWSWLGFKSWTYAQHYWHPPNIGIKCIPQTSKLNFY
jgi:hypothetical protein